MSVKIAGLMTMKIDRRGRVQYIPNPQSYLGLHERTRCGRYGYHGGGVMIEDKPANLVDVG